ncbi:MAG: rRNA maturation RNase YbeY [Patescibacteria group bacterium]
MLKLDLGIVNFTKGYIKRSLIEEAVLNTLNILGVKDNVEISIVFVGDKRMRALNKSFRKKDKSTDVLSFGFEESLSFFKKTKELSLNMGEIVISFPYAKREAKREKNSIDKELALLVSHGVIHIFGIDHERSSEENRKTDNIQDRVINSLFK